MVNRAKQFQPFDALKGFREEIIRRNKIIVSKKELTDDDIDELNNIFREINKGDIIEVIYYSDGEYIKKTGMITNIDCINRILKIVKTNIKFDDIFKICKK